MIKYIDSPYFEGTETSVKEISLGLEKIASDENYRNYPKELVDKIRNIKPEKGFAYILVSAVSCQDWGNNKNADFFPTLALSHAGDDYGYKTYEKLGYWYKQHRNKDPKKSRGKVIASAWDDIMGRILIIVKVDLSKDPETRIALENNYPIRTSMGAKVAYDICKVCHPNWKEFYKIPEKDMIKISKSKSLDEIYAIGEKYGVDLSYIKKIKPEGGPIGIHKTVAEYCEHMKYQRNKITDSGIRAGVVNLRPKFFDISHVGINADRASFVLSKVAGYSDQSNSNEIIKTDKEYDEIIEKMSSDKEAAIHKNVPGKVLSSDIKEMQQYFAENIIPLLRYNEPEMDNESIDLLAEYPLEKVVATMGSLGMFLKPREFQRMVLIRKGFRELADELDKNNYIFPLTGIKADRRLIISKDDVDDDLFNKLLSIIDSKSYHVGPVLKRIEILKKNGPVISKTVIIKKADEIKDRRNPFYTILAPIAALYVASKLGMRGKAEELIGTLKGRKNDVLMSLLGASLLAKAVQMEKEGSFAKDFMLPFVGIPLATFLYGGHVITKAKRGDNVNALERFVVNHPLITSVGGAFLASRAGRGVIKDVYKEIMDGVKYMRKSGSIYENLEKYTESLNMNIKLVDKN